MDRYDSPDEQHDTCLEDGHIYIEGPDGDIEVGSLDAIVDAIGGETYVIEYDATDAALYDWLDTDNPRLEIDVRETVIAFSYPAEFIRALMAAPLEGTESTPSRAERFADMVMKIWDAKGNLDPHVEQ